MSVKLPRFGWLRGGRFSGRDTPVCLFYILGTTNPTSGIDLTVFLARAEVVELQLGLLPEEGP